MEDKLEEKVGELKEAKTGEPKKETPMQEAKRLNKETKDMLEQLQKEKQGLEEIRASNLLDGKGLGGETNKEKTQEEKDQEDADKFINQFS